MKLLTPAQVAEVTQLSEYTILRLCRQGKLPGAKKVGAKWRVVEDRFDEWLAADDATVPEATIERVEGWQ